MRDRFANLLAPMRQSEVRTLVASQVVSGLGDWAGRIALSVLVFERSDSALWTVMVTVVSLLPWLGPGQMLATYADRFGRIRVMVAADVARAALFGVMLIPQPTWMLLVLAFLAGLAVPPASGAQSSTLVEVTEPDQYGNTLALAGVLSQVEILAGYAGGGLLVAVIGSSAALGINAATFVVSALLLLRLRSTAASERHDDAAVGWSGLVAGIAVWRADPLCMRALVLFVGVSAFMILPEVLVVPLTSELDVPDAFVGVFAALIAVGSIIGMVMVPTATDHVALLRAAAVRAGVLAVITAALFFVGVVPVVAGMAFIVSGAVDAIGLPTNQVVGERLPAAGRSAAMAVAGGTLYVGQILAITAAGVAASVSSARVPLTVGALCAVATCAWTVVRPLNGIDGSAPSTESASV